jgi:hypothetical protein
MLCIHDHRLRPVLEMLVNLPSGGAASEEPSADGALLF